MSGSSVLVAGAGATGLAVAWGLAERRVSSVLVDPRPELGGMAATRRRGALEYDVGVHLLHPSHADLVPLVEELCGLEGSGLLAVRSRAAIHFLGRYLDYPFDARQVLRALGLRQSVAVAGSALVGRLRSSAETVAGEESFADVVRSAYGDHFYRLFFRDYTAKVLGLPCEQIAGRWARRRVPLPSRSSLRQLVCPWWRPRRVEHAHSPFLREQFTGPRGLEPMFGAMLHRTAGRARFRPGVRLERVELRDGRVAAAVLNADGAAERLEVDTLVSTIPLPDLVARLTPAPPAPVRAAAGRLGFRGLVAVHLLYGREPALPAQWVYFQEGGTLFNRASEFAQIVPGAFGAGRTLVTAELAGQPEDALWQSPDDALVARTRRDLERLVPALRGAPLLDAFVSREIHAYPRWTVGYERDLAVVLDHVDGVAGLHAVGRQGRYDYLNLDECIDAGRRSGQALGASMERTPPNG